LNALDPAEIRDRLFALGTAPVLLCHERARDRVDATAIGIW
jgi:hypothetical protein